MDSDKIIKPVFFATCFFVILCLYIQAVRASASLDIVIKNARIDIQVKNTPLVDVLTAISSKTGIVIKTADALEDLVTINIKSLPAEVAIQRLLVKKNYALFYMEIEADLFSPKEVWIYGNKEMRTLTPSGGEVNADGPVPNDHMKRYQKNWFAKEFEDDAKLSRQIAGNKISGSSNEENPEPRGIQVTKVAPGSVFSQIGIQKGDIILNVNGSPIDSASDFVYSLQPTPDEPSIIRIERLKANREMDPIYIELH